MKSLFGDWFFWAVLTACLWASEPLFIKYGAKGISPSTGVWIRCAGVALGLGLLPLFSHSVVREVRGMPAAAILALLASGFLSSVIGHLANYRAIQIGEVSRVSPVTGAWPLLAFLLGVLILKEPMTAKKAAGMACVVGGIVLMRV